MVDIFLDISSVVTEEPEGTEVERDVNRSGLALVD